MVLSGLGAQSTDPSKPDYVSPYAPDYGQGSSGVASYFTPAYCASWSSLLNPAAWVYCLPYDASGWTSRAAGEAAAPTPPPPVGWKPPTTEQEAQVDPNPALAAAAQATTNANLQSFFSAQAAKHEEDCKTWYNKAFDATCPADCTNIISQFTRSECPLPEWIYWALGGVAALLILPSVIAGSKR